jgi:hypothetical protein
MSLARLVVTAVRIEGRTKTEVSRDYGVSPRWVYELDRGEPDPASDGRNGGLGLAIVGAIARAHGGTLRLENPPDGGATLDLPAGSLA